MTHPDLEVVLEEIYGHLREPCTLDGAREARAVVAANLIVLKQEKYGARPDAVAAPPEPSEEARREIFREAQQRFCDSVRRGWQNGCVCGEGLHEVHTAEALLDVGIRAVLAATTPSDKAVEAAAIAVRNRLHAASGTWDELGPEKQARYLDCNRYALRAAYEVDFAALRGSHAST